MMTEEDEAFNEIERRAKQRKEAVKAQLDKPKREWVDLTDEQIGKCWSNAMDGAVYTKKDVYNAIRDMLKKENT
jgi:hypothetical protein